MQTDHHHRAQTLVETLTIQEDGESGDITDENAYEIAGNVYRCCSFCFPLPCTITLLSYKFVYTKAILP